MHIYCQWQICSLRSAVSGDISLMPMFLGVRWWDGVKWECSRRKCELSLSIAIFSMKFPTGFKYRNLSKFPGDSTVLVFLTLTASYFTLAFCQHYLINEYDDMIICIDFQLSHVIHYMIDWLIDTLINWWIITCPVSKQSPIQAVTALGAD